MITRQWAKTGLFSLFIAVCVISFTACGRATDTENVLLRVDEALLRADEALEASQIRADSIAGLSSNAQTDAERLELNLDAADAYMTLNLEKALHHIKQAEEITRLSNVATYDSLRVAMKMAFVLNSQGQMIKEAADIFESLDPNLIPDDLKLDYFVLAVQLNRALADRSVDADLKRSYLSLTSTYRDSVLTLDPGSEIIAVNRLMENGEPQKALALLKSSLQANADNDRLGPRYHYISGIYRQLGQPDSQVIYLALAAEDDLLRGVREYRALTELASAISDVDLDRAYEYINRSATDAEMSRSSLRENEVAPILASINETYSLKQRQRNSIIIVIAIALSLMLVTIVITLYEVRRKNRLLTIGAEELSVSHNRLEEINKALSQSNKSLEETNNALAEESRVKEFYITSFMELCLSYLSKMERYRAELGKMAAKSEWKKLTDAINSSRYVNKEISEFYESFDTAFFSLYPDFVEVLNKMLQPRFAYEDTRHLTTELRIYALIWTGINSSKEIARFLRCSESTVYNYRTQMRNKSVDRNSFESDFKAEALSRRRRHSLHL